MARVGIYQIPSDVKDQDKWFRFFNKKQAVVLFFIFLLDYRVLMWAGAHHLLLPALFITLLLTGVAASIVLIPLPADVLYLSGGGIMLDQWLIRIFIRKKEKVLYVKNYRKED